MNRKYFQSFASHKHVLDPAAPILDNTRKGDLVERSLELAKDYLDPEDCHTPFGPCQPFAKQYSCLFYACTLDSLRHPPNLKSLIIYGSSYHGHLTNLGTISED